MEKNLTLTDEQILKNQKRKRTISKYAFIFAIIGFQLVNFIIFYVIQNFNSILMAFQLKSKGEIVWTFENFTRLYDAFFNATPEDELITALTNTFRFFGLNLIMFPISFITSYFMFKKVFGHSLFRVIFFVPSILSAVVWSNLYKVIVGPEGPIVDIIMALTNSDMPLELFRQPYAIYTVMAYSVWMGIAGNFILYGGALSRIPTEVLEAGQIDGLGWFREMVSVIIPLIFPTIGTLLLLQLTSIFMSSGNILLLTGGGEGTTTLSYFIFDTVYKLAGTSNEYNYASAVGIVFTVLTIPIVFGVRSMLNKIEDVQY